MIDRSYAVISGVVLCALVTLVMSFGVLVNSSNDGRPFVVVARQPIAGLSPKSTLTYRGVDAGFVERIRITPEHPRTLYIDVRVYRGIPVTRSTYATLERRLVTGHATLQLDQHEAHAQALPTSEDERGSIPLERSWLGAIKQRWPRTLKKLARFADRLGDVVDDDLARDLRRGLAGVVTVAQRLPGLERAARRALDAVPALAHSARHALGRARRLIAHLDALTGSVKRAATSVAEVGQKGEDIGRRVERWTLPRVNKALSAFAKTLRSVRELARLLHRNPQVLLRGRRRPEKKLAP